MDLHKFGKLLRYSLQFTIVYLILRYAPQISLNSNMSLIIALVLTSLCVIIEFLYKKLLNDSDDGNCNVCDIPPATPPPNCRMVCDVENFDGKINNERLGTFEQGSTIINIPISQMSQEQIQNEIKLREQQQLMDNVEKNNVNKDIALQKDVIPNTFNMPSMNAMYNKQEGIDQNNKNPNDDISRNGNLYDPNKPTMVDIQSDKAKQPFPAGGMFTEVIPDYTIKRSEADIKNELANKQYNIQRAAAVRNNASSIEGYQEPYQQFGKKSQSGKPTQYNVKDDGNVINEYDYSDYNYNHLPMAEGYEENIDQIGYWYLMPSKWFPINPFPGTYVPKNQRENVMPVFADGTATNLKDFYTASSFTGLQNINTSYIDTKLNSGR